MKVSIIVCTFNRAYAITRCLDSIAQSLAAASPIDAEIVVVDNASTDGTSAAVTAWSDSCTFPVRLLNEPRKGLACARNCALRSAQGDILAFTDDDCRMDINYARDLLQHFEQDTTPVLRGGRVELGDPSDLPITIITAQTLRRWNRKINSARYENLGNCLAGCNMTMSRGVVEKLGDFDWKFSTKDIPAGEDADYVYRAYVAGITIEYVPDMVVFHHHGRKTPDEGNRLFRNYMIGIGALYAKHFFRDPNLCRQFYWDGKNAVKEVFTGRNHFWKEIGFFTKHKVAYNIMGAYKYLLLSVKGQPAKA